MSKSSIDQGGGKWRAGMAAINPDLGRASRRVLQKARVVFGTRRTGMAKQARPLGSPTPGGLFLSPHGRQSVCDSFVDNRRQLLNVTES
jgi:hypothetical protein